MRIFQMIPVLFVVTVIIFWGIRLIPGNPAITVLGEKAPEEAIRAMEIKMGLDLPMWKQYLIYINNLVHLDFGQSVRLRESVITLIMHRASVTIIYTIMCTLFTMLIGIPLGLGVQPPIPEWGAIITEGRQYITNAWWICAFPGLALAVMGTSLSLLGEGVSKVLTNDGRR